jgi:lipoate---protein ligase
LKVLKNTVKHSGEKLLRVAVTAENGCIVRLDLSGDFFIYPEDGVDRLEMSVKGCAIAENEILNRMRDTINDAGMELVGLTPETIASAILGAR